MHLNLGALALLFIVERRMTGPKACRTLLSPLAGTDRPNGPSEGRRFLGLLFPFPRFLGLLFPFPPKVKYLAFLILKLQIGLSMEVFGQGGLEGGSQKLAGIVRIRDRKGRARARTLIKILS